MTDTPDTAENAPHMDAIIEDVGARLGQRRKLSWEESSAGTMAAHHTVAALARRGWLTAEARRALGITGDSDATLCWRCGTPLAPGVALRDDEAMAGMPDFPGDTGSSRGQTFTARSSGRLHDVAKCPTCGHSCSLAAEAGS